MSNDVKKKLLQIALNNVLAQIEENSAMALSVGIEIEVVATDGSSILILMPTDAAAINTLQSQVAYRDMDQDDVSPFLIETKNGNTVLVDKANYEKVVVAIGRAIKQNRVGVAGEKAIANNLFAAALADSGSLFSQLVDMIAEPDSK